MNKTILFLLMLNDDCFVCISCLIFSTFLIRHCIMLIWTNYCKYKTIGMQPFYGNKLVFVLIVFLFYTEFRIFSFWCVIFCFIIILNFRCFEQIKLLELFSFVFKFVSHKDVNKFWNLFLNHYYKEFVFFSDYDPPYNANYLRPSPHHNSPQQMYTNNINHFMPHEMYGSSQPNVMVSNNGQNYFPSPEYADMTRPSLSNDAPRPTNWEIVRKTSNSFIISFFMKNCEVLRISQTFMSQWFWVVTLRYILFYILATKF